MDQLTKDSKKKLSNDKDMPVIGLGVWRMTADSEVEQAVLWALEAGYRHIDTAKAYNNEQGVGKAVRKSGIPREEIWVTTKLWNDDQGHSSTLQAIDDSLEQLGMDYVDLYLIHWPFVEREKYSNKREETWKAMEEIYKSGKAKSIGVSNYTIRHLEQMKKYAAILPVVDQVEFHPFLYQKDLLDYCNKENIALEAYSPLIRGQLLNDDRITAIAKKYNKTNAQLVIRWSLQHGNIVIPKSSHKERIDENIQAINFEISEVDMQALNSLNQNLHTAWDPTDIP